MGAGADQVWINQSIFDSKTMTLNGNEGFDTFSYNGVDKGLAAGLVSFEKLTLENISGTYQLDGEFTDLKLYDSTNTASVTTFKGGTGLVNVTGSFENDRVSLEALGGTVAAKAHVNLIGGNDMLLVDHLALKPGSQVFDGGTGHDGVAFSGNVANIGATFQNFEYAYMYDMHGTYDFTDSGISGLIFGNVPTGAMTINGLQTGSVIQIGAAQTTIMNVNVEDALSSKTEVPDHRPLWQCRFRQFHLRTDYARSFQPDRRFQPAGPQDVHHPAWLGQ